jgi:glutamate 5-kinase
MGLTPRPTAIEDLQAASAVGQGKLYRVYDELLRERGVTSAQVLLTFFDMSARTHYLNARQTLRRLLDWSVVPVINENDTTTTDEISFGDNDFLAAQVAILIGADLLVLLTDIEGLYTADPRTDPSAEFIAEITHMEAVERRLRIMDLTALTLCMENGLPIHVFNMDDERNIDRIVSGERVGTLVAT